MAAAGLTEELTCVVCLGLYQDPVALPCQHSFCAKCIGDFWDHSVTRFGVNCPQCHRSFKPRPSLVKNHTLQNIVEMYSQCQPTAPAAGPSPVMCEYCIDSPSLAVKTCLKCETSFCSHHLQPHLTKPIYKDHGLIEPIADFTTRQCPTHKKVLEFYCEQDEECVCISCTVIGKHKSHSLLTLEEAKDKIKGKLQSEVKNLREHQNDCTSKQQSLKQQESEAKRHIKEMRGKLSTEFSGWRKQLEEDEKTVLKMIDDEEHRVLSRIKSESDSLVEKMDKLQLIEKESQDQKDALSFIQDVKKLLGRYTISGYNRVFPQYGAVNSSQIQSDDAYADCDWAAADYDDANPDYDDANHDNDDAIPDYDDANADYDVANADHDDANADYDDANADHDDADYDDANANNDDANADYDDAKDDADANPDYDDANADYDDANADYDDANTDYDDAKDDADDANPDYDDANANNDDANADYDDAKDDADDANPDYDDANADYDDANPDYDDANADANADNNDANADYDDAKDDADADYDDANADYDWTAADYDDANPDYDDDNADYDEAKADYDDPDTDYDNVNADDNDADDGDADDGEADEADAVADADDSLLPHAPRNTTSQDIHVDLSTIMSSIQLKMNEYQKYQKSILETIEEKSCQLLVQPLLTIASTWEVSVS
ncbi:uncharacterized protein LOC144599020 [Rhinoraja longicauda]